MVLASSPACEARGHSGNRWIATPLSTLFEELRDAWLPNYFAQPDKLICALIWLHVTPTFKIMHRRGADRA